MMDNFSFTIELLRLVLSWPAVFLAIFFTVYFNRGIREDFVNSAIGVIQAIIERGGRVKLSGKDIIIEVKEQKRIDKVRPGPEEIKEVPVSRDRIEKK